MAVETIHERRVDQKSLVNSRKKISDYLDGSAIDGFLKAALLR